LIEISHRKEGIILVSNFNIEEARIMDIQKAFKKGITSSKDLVLMYLDRISRLEQKGPKLNAIIELNPDAIQIAEALDWERETKGIRSNLHGIPVLIKDNIETGDKMHTSAGSYALKDSYAKEDACLVRLLREAGAIILGKTNMTEWASYMSDSMPAGYSSRGGTVLSPYGPGLLDPGGSSSGSGVAVTSNFCAVAIGTETSGSIINPSNNLSIVGIKPTLGLVSRSGIIPASHMQDTAGPMARTVEDAAILLNEIAGYDKNDPATICNQEKERVDYTSFLDAKGLSGVRIGIPNRSYYNDLSDEEIEVFDSTIKLMKQHGVTFVDNIEISPDIKLQSKLATLYEFKVGLNAYLSKLAPHIPVHSFSDLIAFNKMYPEKMLKYGQSYLTDLEDTSVSLTDEEYIKNRIKDLTISRECLETAITSHNVDVLVFPKDKPVELVNKAGFPMITVPAGQLNNGMPFGITFVGRTFSEGKLIKISYAYEQLSSKRIKPNLTINNEK
jgi:amidase